MVASVLAVWAELTAFCCHQPVCLVFSHIIASWSGVGAWQKEKEASEDHLGQPSHQARVCHTGSCDIRTGCGLGDHLIQLLSWGKLSHREQK